MSSVEVDRGRYPEAVTPWDRADWREGALGWVRDRLAGRGLRPEGVPEVRLRPWSVLMRVPVAGREAVWFKANPPASAFEGALTAALAALVPSDVLHPLAVDPARGWALLPDGGPLLRTVLAHSDPGPRAWEDLLRRYGAVQRALVPHTEELARLGVPRVPTAEVPAEFDALAAVGGAAGPADRARLAALRPRLAGWCAELAGLGVPDSLDHADLHEGQVFHPEPGRYTLFDWGDAVLSHPFAGLRVPAGRAVARYGPEVLPRLRDAYLEAWTDCGAGPAELRRAVRLAWRLGALGRARAWDRVFPSGTAAAATAPERVRALLDVAETVPL